jgi:hypothetical protein
VIAIVSLFVAIGYPVSSFAQIIGSSQLNIERRGHTATLLGDGKVLIIGGDNQNGTIGQSEIFDPATKRLSSGHHWQPRERTMLRSRSQMGVCW